MTSPVASLWGGLLNKMSGASEFGVLFDDDSRQRILCAVLDAWHAHAQANGVIFDTNRSWTGRAAVISKLYPSAQIICCVRDVGWILDSIEVMLNKNPLQLSRVLGFSEGVSVYGRAETLMNSENGLVGRAWSTLREAWFGDHAESLLVVTYESLVGAPEKTIRGIYTAINEPWFAHDFDNVSYDAPDYDVSIGMPGLHKVREQVRYVERKPVIPPDLFAKYAGANFWRRDELNARKVSVI